MCHHADEVTARHSFQIALARRAKLRKKKIAAPDALRFTRRTANVRVRWSGCQLRHRQRRLQAANADVRGTAK